MQSDNLSIGTEYKSHPIFDDIKLYIDFYEMLSSEVYVWLSSGTTQAFNFNAPMFSAMQGSLHSIQLILQEGRINDAHSLLRRYYDSIVMNIYADLYVKKNVSIENMLVVKVNNWLTGKEALPEYRVLNDYLLNAPELSDITSLLRIDKRYKDIRNRCNDHTHYNLFYYMVINDNQVYDENRIKLLDLMSSDIKDLFIMHFVFIFTLNPHFMMSGEHVGYLEMGQTPPEDSQYWVASYIQEVFDKIVKTHREDLANLLKESITMHLD